MHIELTTEGHPANDHLQDAVSEVVKLKAMQHVASYSKPGGRPGGGGGGGGLTFGRSSCPGCTFVQEFAGMAQ